jgi:uncharacterized protein
MTALDPQRAFLGVGWVFPPSLDAGGRIAEAAYDEDVRQALRIILGTNPGERVMRPDFGAGLDRVVFEPVNSATLTEVEARVRTAVVTWEPRVEVEQVSVTQQGSPPAVLLIELHYRVRATNTRANLVYPFYLEEGSGP